MSSVHGAFRGKKIWVGCSGIHIRSRPVVPDDYSLARTTEVTPKVVLWKSEILLNHKIFPENPILFYHVHFTCVWVLLIYLFKNNGE